MKQYGIIGKPVAQSFSARYFSEKFVKEHIDAEYRLYECDSQAEVKSTISRLDGCNITIPYKQAVMPLLDDIDPTAREIGAVNVVKRVKGKKAKGQEGEKLIGYNTDWCGFVDSIKPLLNENDNHNYSQALIFGTGGAAKAVYYGLKQLGIVPTMVSRTPQTGQLSYVELTPEVMSSHTILVNATPLGMWPNIDSCVDIPYHHISSAHILYDCVYNPEETLFLRQGRQQGARTLNGLGMLYGQAQAAWQIWNK